MNEVRKSEDFAAWIGLDWADKVHAGAMIVEGTWTAEPFDLEQSAEAIDEWAMALRKRFGGRSVAVCLEQAKGGLIYALMKYDFLVLYPVNPAQLKSYREALKVSRAKDDPTDAERLAWFLCHYHAHLRAWRPDDQTTRLIDALTINRRRLVDLRKDQINRIRGYLKLYFPQVFELLGEFDTGLAAAFLKKWPTLEKLQRAHPDTIRQFYVDHSCRSRKVIEQRLEKIRDAQPLTTDAAIVESSSFMVQAIAGLLEHLNESIEQIELRIAELMDQHPDAELFKVLPGAGAAMAPRLLAAFGTDRTRFASAAEVQQYSGIAPVTRRSGQSHSVHRRLACSRFLRQTFHEFARLSIRQSAWARAYYQMQLARGKSFHVAVRALAFKWIRILYHCWKTRTPYNELHYLTSLQQRNSPLLEYIK